MPGDDELGAFYAAWWVTRRRGRRGITITPSTRPTMPKAQWRSLAAICFAVGAVVGALIPAGSNDVLVLRAIVVGLIGVAVGMYVIETIWERRRRQH